MAKFLLDTNVLSEMSKPSPNVGVMAWIDCAVEDDLFLSVVSLAEIKRGVEQLAAGRKQAAYRAWLTALIGRFDGRILPITCDVALAAGELEVKSMRAGRPMGLADVLIAASAHVHAVTLVTRDVGDFEGVPVEVLNPWTSP